jgi:hypothetical protein
LERNGEGQLHSIDIASDVGVLVEGSDQWHLHVCDVGQIEGQLGAIFAREGPIDIFFHDSDHRYLSQLFEYETFAMNASERGLLISDDIDMSHAFEEFCQNRVLIPNCLFDARKVAGMVRLGSH